MSKRTHLIIDLAVFFLCLVGIALGAVPIPTYSPASGTYNAAADGTKNVTISSGGQVVWALDGDEPGCDAANSPVVAKVPVGTHVLKSAAMVDGKRSPLKAVTFTVKPSPTPKPTATPTPKPTPTPTATPTATPFPTATPKVVSQNGTRVDKDHLTGIVDNSLNVWTIDFANLRVLRNGENIGQGYGSVLLWWNGYLYVLGTDMNWWQWADSLGNIVGIRGGKEDPSTSPTPPPATPTPAPTDTPTPRPTGTPGPGSKTVTIAWDLPKDTGGVPVTGYHILISTNGHYFADEDNVDVPDPKATRWDVKGLQPSTTYWFGMTAYNNAGDSFLKADDVISYTTLPAAAANKKATVKAKAMKPIK